jgi:hypothetical protein
MNYERQASDPPLILLHAGFMRIEQSFEELQPTVSKPHAAMAAEQQTNGEPLKSIDPLAMSRWGTIPPP